MTNNLDNNTNQKQIAPYVSEPTPRWELEANIWKKQQELYKNSSKVIKFVGASQRFLAGFYLGSLSFVNSVKYGAIGIKNIFKLAFRGDPKEIGIAFDKSLFCLLEALLSPYWLAYNSTGLIARHNSKFPPSWTTTKEAYDLLIKDKEVLSKDVENKDKELKNRETKINQQSQEINLLKIKGEKTDKEEKKDLESETESDDENEKNLNDLKKAISTLENEKKLLETNLQKLKSENEKNDIALNKKITNLTNDKSDLNDKIKELEDRISKLAKRNFEIENEFRQLHTKKLFIESKNINNEKLIEKLKIENNDKDNTIKNKDDEINKIKIANSEKKDKAIEKIDNLELTKKMEKLGNENIELKNKIISSEQDVINKENKINELEKGLIDKENQIKKLKKELLELNNDFDELEEFINEEKELPITEIKNEKIEEKIVEISQENPLKIKYFENSENKKNNKVSGLSFYIGQLLTIVDSNEQWQVTNIQRGSDSKWIFIEKKSLESGDVITDYYELSDEAQDLRLSILEINERPTQPYPLQVKYYKTGRSGEKASLSLYIDKHWSSPSRTVTKLMRSKDETTLYVEYQFFWTKHKETIAYNLVENQEQSNLFLKLEAIDDTSIEKNTNPSFDNPLKLKYSEKNKILDLTTYIAKQNSINGGVDYVYALKRNQDRSEIYVYTKVGKWEKLGEQETSRITIYRLNEQSNDPLYTSLGFPSEDENKEIEKEQKKLEEENKKFEEEKKRLEDEKKRLEDEKILKEKKKKDKEEKENLQKLSLFNKEQESLKILKDLDITEKKPLKVKLYKTYTDRTNNNSSLEKFYIGNNIQYLGSTCKITEIKRGQDNKRIIIKMKGENNKFYDHAYELNSDQNDNRVYSLEISKEPTAWYPLELNCYEPGNEKSKKTIKLSTYINKSNLIKEPSGKVVDLEKSEDNSTVYVTYEYEYFNRQTTTAYKLPESEDVSSNLFFNNLKTRSTDTEEKVDPSFWNPLKLKCYEENRTDQTIELETYIGKETKTKNTLTVVTDIKKNDDLNEIYIYTSAWWLDKNSGNIKNQESPQNNVTTYKLAETTNNPLYLDLDIKS